MRVVRKMMPEAKNKSTRKDQANSVDLGTKAPGVCTFNVWGAYAAGMFCCFRVGMAYHHGRPMFC